MIPIRPINWLKIVILAVIWGASFMFVTIALTGVGPLDAGGDAADTGCCFSCYFMRR